jgi:peptidoglycan-associated lipoprotein
MNTKRSSAIILAITLSLFAAGCKKKVPAPPAPPPPVVRTEPPPAPKPKPVISSFTAEPSTIERGQASTLKWSVTGADSITIDNGVGTVQADGTRSVFPSSTTTYRLSASGPGGTASESVTVNVTAPPTPTPPAPAPAKISFTDRVNRDLADAFYDYDKSDIREDARNQLTKNADTLKAIFAEYSTGTVTIEGHCDERGSAEYNLGLGDRRSTAAKDFLVQLGVPADRLKTISYGKERPQCTESNEACWQKNRRAHFSAQ